MCHQHLYWSASRMSLKSQSPVDVLQCDICLLVDDMVLEVAIVEVRIHGVSRHTKVECPRDVWNNALPTTHRVGGVAGKDPNTFSSWLDKAWVATVGTSDISNILHTLTNLGANSGPNWLYTCLRCHRDLQGNWTFHCACMSVWLLGGHPTQAFFQVHDVSVIWLTWTLTPKGVMKSITDKATEENRLSA